MVLIDQQRVVITGAAQGLGAAIARAFAARGADLVLIDRDEAGLRSVKAQTGGKVLTLTVDLTDAADTRRVIVRMLADGPIDTLIHNAAALRPQPLEEVSFETFRATIDVGLQAGFLLTQAVWSTMKARGGALIFVSSQSGIKGFVGETAYCAAKHGLEGFAKSLALEGEGCDIVSCTITPGHSMRTPMSEANYTPELKRQWIEPDRLAPAFLEIAEFRDPGMNGQRLNAWEIAQQIESRK